MAGDRFANMSLIHRRKYFVRRGEERAEVIAAFNGMELHKPGEVFGQRAAHADGNNVVLSAMEDFHPRRRAPGQFAQATSAASSRRFVKTATRTTQIRVARTVRTRMIKHRVLAKVNQRDKGDDGCESRRQ